MHKKAASEAMVAMIVLLVMIAVVIFLPREMLMKAGGEATTSAACSISMSQQEGGNLWASPKGNTLINKEKEAVTLNCYTSKQTIDTADEREASGKIVTLMENCLAQYSKRSTLFFLDKGSICITCDSVELREKKALESLAGILAGNEITGFSPEKYINFRTDGDIAVMAVLGYSFIPEFELAGNAGVLLWDKAKYDELPCAILEGTEGNPVSVVKGYT